MLDSSETEQPRSTPEASTLYSNFIKPGDTVISVGPNAHIYRDPTLFFAANQLKDRGKLLVADPQWDPRTVDVEEIAKNTDVVSVGHGGVKDHIAELDALRSLGVPLAHPEWLGEQSSAKHLNCPNNSIDVIMDRGTSPFLNSNWGKGVVENPQKLVETYREYSTKLKAGGVVLLQVKQDKYHTEDGKELDYKKLLEEAGLKVRELKVKDTFQIPLSEDVYEQIAESQNPNNQFLEISDGKEMLRLDNRTEDRLFVATKPT